MFIMVTLIQGSDQTGNKLPLGLCSRFLKEYLAVFLSLLMSCYTSSLQDEYWCLKERETWTEDIA